MKSSTLIKNRIGNKRCAVLGFGVSNIPLVELLLECGNEITVYDKTDFDRLDAKARNFAERGVKFITGEKYLDAIDADIIFRSPGIRPDYSGIKNAVLGGAELTSEMELFIELTPAAVFGITGSDGKTTTTTITYKLLEKEFEKTDRHIYVGGNIGTPLLSRLGEMTENDICVLELSSFQLFTARKSPSRAIITNLSPNHLDWHKDMAEYVEAKTNIYSHGASTLVTNADNELCMELVNSSDVDIGLFSAYLTFEEMTEVCPTAKSYVFLRDGKIYHRDGKAEKILLDASEILIPGLHNIENYMAAISLLWGLVSRQTEQYIAKTFAGVEHRLEFVRRHNGVAYFNSSIDSSPTRTAAALSALPVKPIVICGGYDKNIPFEPLAHALHKRSKAVILTGATAEKIKDAIDRYSSDTEVYIQKDFDKAVLLAKEIANDGDTVLLSPACASFDAFENFMERGNRFKQIVNEF